MARSTIEQRHDAERQRIERYDAILRQPRARKALDIDAIIRSVIDGRTGQVIRDPGSWRLRVKTKDPGRLALAIARHVFAAFPVPQQSLHLVVESPHLVGNKASSHYGDDSGK